MRHDFVCPLYTPEAVLCTFRCQFAGSYKKKSLTLIKEAFRNYRTTPRTWVTLLRDKIGMKNFSEGGDCKLAGVNKTQN